MNIVLAFTGNFDTDHECVNVRVQHAVAIQFTKLGRLDHDAVIACVSMDGANACPNAIRAHAVVLALPAHAAFAPSVRKGARGPPFHRTSPPSRQSLLILSTSATLLDRSLSPPHPQPLHSTIPTMGERMPCSLGAPLTRPRSAASEEELTFNASHKPTEKGECLSCALLGAYGGTDTPSSFGSFPPRSAYNPI
jgi:hypothetical protein